MEKQYNISTRLLPALPRDKRLLWAESSGSGGTVTGVSSMDISDPALKGDGHTHQNLELLSRLSDDELNYLYLQTHNPDADLDEEAPVYLLQKIKAGYADKAYDLDDDSPVHDKFLSRLTDDEAIGLIRFLKGLIAEELVECRGGLWVKSSLTEEGETETLSMKLLEEGDTPELLSLALTEESSGSYGGTLGTLSNVNAAADDILQTDVVLVKLRGSDMWTQKLLSELGGGGTGGGVSIKLRALSSTALSGVVGMPLLLGYNFTSVYADDQQETGSGTAVYKVNGIQVKKGLIQQGDTYFDTAAYLNTGTNTVTVEVTDSVGNSRSLSFAVELINLSISSSFDATQVFGDAISYRYTPVGAISKTVHFVVDGQELASEVTSISNRQLTYTIPAQRHGSHTLRVYMSATVNEVAVESNSLYYDLVCIEAGNMTPVIASAFNRTAVDQYEAVSIPFMVYNPALSTAAIRLLVNGTLVAEQTVDRTEQKWNYRLDNAGMQTLKIVCGTVEKVFTIQVTESAVLVEAETQDLAVYLTSVNRSNNDKDKQVWKYGSVSAALTGFNWATNGWLPSIGGSVALRVSGDARVRIPYQLFARDFRQGGKTIEFEFSTRDVTDYEAVVIDCYSGGIGLQITAQHARIQSEQTTVETRFKEGERVRVSFVAEKRSEHRLLYIYINGIMSGVEQYPVEDNFQQRNPVDIVIGSNACTIDLYNIRMYDNNLTQYQMLDNYMADIDDLEKKLTKYLKNQVYNPYGDILYTSVLKQIPGLIITGSLPQYKGDKKTVDVSYTNLQDPSKSFTATGVQIDVQGTSSQYYPRKNYKMTFKKGFVMSATGETVAKYAHKEGAIPVDCFTFKADFAESSSTHNTGMAKLIEQVFRDRGLLVPPQKTDERVRTTVDGFPMTIFHRAVEADEVYFLGKYNFNNDKSTFETFGFVTGCECWEFLNNTSDNVLFKTADFSTNDWKNDFEGRYPDKATDTTRLQQVLSWIVSTNGNPAKFKAEIAQYFHVDMLILYYLVTEMFAMVDQRAKNMFITAYGNDKWLFIFYDNDTCLGINNEGMMAFNYNVEYHDTIGAQSVWNGEQSVLWNNIETCFPDEIAAMYQDMRSKGQISYEKTMKMLNEEQAGKWCEAIYNADGKFKYIDPLIEQGNGSYLYAAQGSREEHRKWWTYNRFRYMDSKYNAGDFLSDYITMRLYTPTNWTGVAPNADFHFTPYADQYIRVKYGSYIRDRRCYKDQPVTIEAPAIQFNDTETIIYGAAYIRSLGDLSGKYAGTVDVSKGTNLTELLIGSGVTGYQNTNLMHVSVGNNKMLRKIDVRNCPNLKQPLDLSGCENLEVVLAQGTGLTAVVLPPAGILTEMRLPETLTNLTVKNQSKLTDASFTLAGVGNLTTLVLENMNNVNVFALIDRCLALPEVILSRVRLTGIQGSSSGLATLAALVNIPGMDEHGNNTDRAVVTGKYHAYGVSYDKHLEDLRSTFKELEITYEKLAVYFEDKLVEQLAVAQWDKDKDGYLQQAETEVVNTIGYKIFNDTAITSFDELGKRFVNATVIWQACFEHCDQLKSVTLPPKLKTVGTVAFSGCSVLEKVDFPDTVESIGNYAFSKCTNLKSVHLPALLTVLERNFFQYCSSLISVVIPDSVVTMEREVFRECTSLQSVVLSKNVVVLPEYTFAKCSSLESFVIPNQVTKLGDRCFEYCTALKTVELSNTLTELGAGAFYACSALESVVIPRTVVTMLNNVFQNCSVLKQVRVLAEQPPTLGTSGFSSAHSTLKIYVPDASVQAYKTATNWSGYASKIYPLSEYISL